MRRLFYAFIIIALFVGCKTAPTHPGLNPDDVWADAALVAGLRAEIAQLERDIADMELNSREISDRIERITDRLVSGLDRGRTIEDIFREIDEFVRALIEENIRLRNLRGSDWGEDAGPGHGFILGLSGYRRA